MSLAAAAGAVVACSTCTSQTKVLRSYQHVRVGGAGDGAGGRWARCGRGRGAGGLGVGVGGGGGSFPVAAQGRLSRLAI